MAPHSSHVQPCEPSDFAAQAEELRRKAGRTTKWLTLLGVLCGLLCLSLASLLAVAWPCLMGTFRPCNCHAGDVGVNRPLTHAAVPQDAVAVAAVPLPVLQESVVASGHEVPPLPVATAPEARALSGSASSGSQDSTKHQGHPHDALLYLFHAFIIGTVLLHITTLPGLHNLQTTVVLFLAGIAYSLVHEWLQLDDKLGVLGHSHVMWMGVDPHLILFTMLPALLAGDAIQIDTSVVKRVAAQCMYLAGPGVLLSALLTALFVMAYLGWSFYLSLTMGAILAATDPVAVVGLLKQLGAPPTLTIQIAGESLLNDGTAIVLFTLAYELLQGKVFTVTQVVIFVVRKALCACIVGWIIGWIFVLWINAASNRFEHHSSTIQIALTFCCAYWSFIMAEGVLDMSGVLCTVVACLVLADKMWMSILEKESMHTVWHVFEFLGNTIIFFLAGALTGNCMAHMVWQDYMHLLVLYLVTTLIRGLIIGFSTPILKFLSPDKKPVSIAEAILMTWGGLRGAVGLALAIQVSAERAGGLLPEDDARRVLFYTGGIATLTLVINATTCPLLVKALGIVHQDDTKRSVLLCLHKQMAHMVETRAYGRHKAVSKVIKDVLKEVEHEVGAGGLDLQEMNTMSSMQHVNDVDSAVAAASANSEAFLDVNPSPSAASSGGRRMSTSSNASSLVQLGAENAKVMARRFLVQKLATQKPVDAMLKEYKQATEWRSRVPRAHMELMDIPEAVLDKSDADSDWERTLLRDVVSKRHVDARMVQVVNSTFLALLKAEYWHQIEAGKFPEGSSHPEVLLSSVASAVQKADEGLGDLDFILDELGLTVTEPEQNWFQESEAPDQDSVKRMNTGRRRASLASFEQVMEVSNVLASSNRRTSERKETRLLKMVRSSTFNAVFIVLICVNALFMFVEEAKRVPGSNDAPWQVVEALLILSFFVEFVLKAVVYKLDYFRSLWNVYDVLLIIFAVASLIVERTWDHDDGSPRENYSAEARIPRLYRLFRAMFFMRVFRLVKLCQVVKMAFKGHDASAELAKNLRSIIILTAFVRAHGRSQEHLPLYFNGFQACEQARCILESQTMINRALVLAAKVIQKVPRPTLERLIVLRESSHVAEELSKYVREAHELGVVSAREADTLLKPIRERSQNWHSQLRESEMGITKSQQHLNRENTRLHLNETYEKATMSVALAKAATGSSEVFPVESTMIEGMALASDSGASIDFKTVVQPESEECAEAGLEADFSMPCCPRPCGDGADTSGD